MSTSTTNLFAFDRALPAPFDTLKSKKISVTSTYGDGTISTLCASVIKAVHAVCRCMSGTGEGAVGVIDHRTVAEYKSSAGPDAYHLVVYGTAPPRFWKPMWPTRPSTTPLRSSWLSFPFS